MSATTPSPEPLVQVDGLHTYYGKSHILHGVSLRVGRGEVVGLIGRNGVGKSTTLKTIMGLVNARQGEIKLEGSLITHEAPHRLARRGIGYVPEDRRIFRLLTVMENLRTGFDRKGVTEERKKALLDKVFAYFPVLAERRDQAGGTLSGGEQQMLAIARALMLEPKILLLDEPSLGLAPLIVVKIFEVIRALRERGIPVLLVEQNAHMALRTADRAYVLETGEIKREVPAGQLHDDPSIREAYLGA